MAGANDMRNFVLMTDRRCKRVRVVIESYKKTRAHSLMQRIWF